MIKLAELRPAQGTSATGGRQHEVATVVALVFDVMGMVAYKNGMAAFSQQFFDVRYSLRSGRQRTYQTQVAADSIFVPLPLGLPAFILYSLGPDL